MNRTDRWRAGAAAGTATRRAAVSITRVLPAAALCFLASCGGGGGGGTTGVQLPPVGGGLPLAGVTLPPVYEFTLSDTGGVADRLVARTDFGGTPAVDVIIDSRIEPTLGEYDFASRTVTFTAGAVAAQSDFGSMVIDILAPVVLPPASPPDDVLIEVTLALEGLVRMRFLNGTVELQRGSGPTSTVTLEEFEGFLANRLTEPVWRHQTALAWAVLDLLRHLVAGTADAIALIDAGLQTAAAVDRMCDLMPGAPPPGSIGQGMARLTWLGSGAISNGNDFTLDYTSCWLAGNSGRGVLLDGRVNLRGLNATVSGGRFIQIGFQSFGALGGVLFEDLGVSATLESMPAATLIVSERSFVLRNGIRIRFDAP